MKNFDFETIEYLKSGNVKQQHAYEVLTKYLIFEKLSSFNPLLVGTIPINIDITDSDLDIICCFEEPDLFYNTITKHFANESGFSMKNVLLPEGTAIVAQFELESYKIEVFGQNIPTKSQKACKHMLIEHRILSERGEKFREKIIELKMNGHKTEPAFAVALGLKGNAYEELLTYGENKKWT